MTDTLFNPEDTSKDDLKKLISSIEDIARYASGTTSQRTIMNHIPVLIESSFRLGIFIAESESTHTCNLNHLRRPWPPSKNCEGCRFYIEKIVEREKLQMPYLLFGWDAIVDNFNLKLECIIRQKNLNLAKRALNG